MRRILRAVLSAFAAANLALVYAPAACGDDVKDTPPPQHETVVVTGTYDPLPLEEADRSVDLLPVKPLELLSNTIADFLRLDPSVSLGERAPNGVQADVSIRGGSFGQTLILLNGMRMNDAQSGHLNMDLPISPEMLDRIEVLKGSGSTLYGSDAVDGVVNFITRVPDTSEMRLRSALGNFGTNQERAYIVYGTPKFGEAIDASRDFSSGFIPDRDYRNLSFSSVTRYTTWLGSTDGVLGYDDKPYGADQFYGNFPSWERTKTWFASLQQEFGENTQASFAFRRHSDLFVLFRDNPQIYTNRHIVDGWQGTLRRSDSLGRLFKIHYGIEGYHDAIDSSNLGQHERSRESAYIAVDARALKRFSVSAGVREELYGTANSQVSPTLSGGYWISEHFRLRASASRAFRLPSYTDLYYHDPANVGSPTLLPEKAWSYEGGLDVYAGRTRGSVVVFERRERDGIDYVRNSPTDIWRATNFDRLNFTGVEASAQTTLGRAQQLELSYTGLHGAQNSLGGQQSKYVFNYPIHTGLVSWIGTLPKGMLLRVRVGAAEQFARDPYGVLDFYAASTRGRVHPFLQLSNLTDTHFQEVAGVPMPGRSVVGGVEWTVFSNK